MKTRNEIMAAINKLTAQLAAIKEENVRRNTIILHEELLNLQQGVGEGFVSGDYYALDRYYSRIPGVKNIRIDRDMLQVKITDNRGLDLPEEFNNLKVVLIPSTHYTNEVVD